MCEECLFVELARGPGQVCKHCGGPLRGPVALMAGERSRRDDQRLLSSPFYRWARANGTTPEDADTWIEELPGPAPATGTP